jgi:hypothetical protein
MDRAAPSDLAFYGCVGRVGRRDSAGKGEAVAEDQDKAGGWQYVYPPKTRGEKIEDAAMLVAALAYAGFHYLGVWGAIRFLIWGG